MLSSFVFQDDHLKKLQTKNGQIHLTDISMNYRTIEFIDILPRAFHNILVLQLNHNLLESLKGIEQFTNLEILSVNYNYIKHTDEFARISQKRKLRTLNLVGNPCEAQPNCTFQHFQTIFPNLAVFNATNQTARQQSARRSVGVDSNQYGDTISKQRANLFEEQRNERRSIDDKQCRTSRRKSSRFAFNDDQLILQSLMSRPLGSTLVQSQLQLKQGSLPTAAVYTLNTSINQANSNNTSQLGTARRTTNPSMDHQRSLSQSIIRPLGGQLNTSMAQNSLANSVLLSNLGINNQGGNGNNLSVVHLPGEQGENLMNTANFAGNSLKAYLQGGDFEDTAPVHPTGRFKGPRDSVSILNNELEKIHTSILLTGNSPNRLAKSPSFMEEDCMNNNQNEGTGDLSIVAKKHLDKHITTIDDDVEKYAAQFWRIHAMEAPFKCLKYLVEKRQKRLEKADTFHQQIREMQVFYYWKTLIRTKIRRVTLRQRYQQEFKENLGSLLDKTVITNSSMKNLMGEGDSVRQSNAIFPKASKELLTPLPCSSSGIGGNPTVSPFSQSIQNQSLEYRHCLPRSKVHSMSGTSPHKNSGFKTQGQQSTSTNVMQNSLSALSASQRENLMTSGGSNKNNNSTSKRVSSGIPTMSNISNTLQGNNHGNSTRHYIA